MRRALPALIAFLVLTVLSLAAPSVALPSPAVDTAAAPRAAWTWPVSGDVITPYRNGSDPYAAGQHRGIDVAAPAGTQVRAAAAGEVRFAGTAGSSGLTVSVRTGDGYDTSYLHLASVSVRAGAQVFAGDRLGTVGTTGTRAAAVPHLHFGVRTAGSRHAYHDPMRFLPPLPAASRPPAAPLTTAPEPSPAPPAAAPAPAEPNRAPGPLPAPSPAGRDVRIPRGAPFRVRRPAAHTTPAPRHAPGPAAADAPGRALSPRAARRPVPASTGSPSPAAGPAHRPAVSPGPSGEHRPLPAAGRPAAIIAGRRPAADHGPNVGWALACGGLLLAAGLLGLSEDGRRGTRRTRARVAGALRPGSIGCRCRTTSRRPSTT